MKTAKKILSAAAAAALLSAMLCTGASAARDSGSRTGQIRVIVENNTLSAEDGADWTGTLVDEWVSFDSDTTAVSAFLGVLDSCGYTQTGAESDYITEINGLSAEDGGAMGGWMISIDNWFTDEVVSAYTAGSGKLESGDELRFSYSTQWGADLGYDWSGADTSLCGIEFSAGVLTPEFDGAVYDYILELPDGADSITAVPDALNKYYRAKVYLNEYTPALNGTDHKPSDEISVREGDTIIVGVGSEFWMSANYNNAQESVYKFHIGKENEIDIKVQETVSAIDAIGEVTYSSRSLIESARSLYDSLSDEQKALVTNYDALTSAEEAFAALTQKENAVSTQTLRDNALSVLASSPEFGNEWDVIAVSRFGLADEAFRNGYISSLCAKLDEVKSPKLSETRSTVNSGVVAALTALGADPTDFYGYDLTAPLSEVEYVSQQGINGAVYSLIALDTHGYGDRATRDALISILLDAQEEDGGWTIDTWTGVDDGSDADMTAMVIQSLAPYENESGVREAVIDALAFLSENQTGDGAFVSYGNADSESCAQSLIALCAVGADVNENESFIKNNNTVFDGLLRFYNDTDKGFAHLEGGESNYLSTYQAYTAAAALYRVENEMTSLFDMTDTALEVVKEKSESKPESEQDSTTESEQESARDSGTESLPVPDGGSVKTGDGTPLAAVMLLMISCSAAAVIAGRRSKKSGK